MAKGYWIVGLTSPTRRNTTPTAPLNGEAFRKYGGRFLVRGGAFENAVGKLRPRNVVIEFPTLSRRPRPASPRRNTRQALDVARRRRRRRPRSSSRATTGRSPDFRVPDAAPCYRARQSEGRRWPTCGWSWSAPPAAWGGRWSAPSPRRQASRSPAAIERAGSPEIGKDAGELAGLGANGVAITDDALPPFAKADGVLDFTAPAATRRLRRARGAGAHRPCHRHDRACAPTTRRRSRQRRATRRSSSPATCASASTCWPAWCGRRRRRSRRLRHRDPRDAPPQEGRRALRHRADARRGRRGGPRHRPRRAHSVRAPRRPYRRAQARRHRLCDAARRLGDRRAQRHLRRRRRAHRAHAHGRRTAACSRAAR